MNVTNDKANGAGAAGCAGNCAVHAQIAAATRDELVGAIERNPHAVPVGAVLAAVMLRLPYRSEAELVLVNTGKLLPAPDARITALLPKHKVLMRGRLVNPEHLQSLADATGLTPEQVLDSLPPANAPRSGECSASPAPAPKSAWLWPAAALFAGFLGLKIGRKQLPAPTRPAANAAVPGAAAGEAGKQLQR